MKIISLQSENIKRLIAVEIKPTENLVEITGKNGNGKTSVLDSIWWALAGAANIQDDPIRHGATTARIRLDLGEIIVTRVFKPSGSVLTVENAEGGRFGSPQAMLDGLLGALTFDPLEFSRMKERDQFDALRKFVPEVDFDSIDALNLADYEKRKEANRRAKESRTKADAIPEQVVPAGTVNREELLNQLAEAGKTNGQIQIRAERRQKMREEINEKTARAQKILTDAKATADAARIALEVKLKESLAEAEALRLLAQDMQDKLQTADPLPQPVDVSSVRAQVDAEEARLKLETQQRERASHLRDVSDADMTSFALTKAMEFRESTKQSAIAAAKLPVPGISFGPGKILLGGVPFKQASDAEQLRASIAIAMAGNPKLRVLRVRDGSLLDSGSMKIIEKMAEDQDFQVWIEKVDESGAVGFVIEDGRLKDVRVSEPV